MWSTGQGSEAPRGSPVTTWVGVREGPQINPTHPISFPPFSFLVLKSSLPFYLVPGPSTAKGGVGGRGGGGWREVGGRSLRCSSGSGQGVCVCGGGTVRSSFPPRSPLRAQKGRMTLPLNQLPRTSSRDSRTAQTGLRPRLPPERGRGPSLPTSPFWSSASEALLPQGRWLRGFPRRGPEGRGPVPGRPPGSVPRPTLAGLFPNSLFTATMVPGPVSVLAGFPVPPPIPVLVLPPAPVSLPAPVPGSVPLSFGVAFSVRAGVPVWVPLSRPGPGLAIPRRMLFHGSVPRPAPERPEGNNPQVSPAGGQAWGRGRAGRDGTLTCAHAH